MTSWVLGLEFMVCNSSVLGGLLGHIVADRMLQVSRLWSAEHKKVVSHVRENEQSDRS